MELLHIHGRAEALEDQLVRNLIRPGERKRRAVLEAAKQKIESPQPAVREIRKKVLATCDWERGELIAYRTRMATTSF